MDVALQGSTSPSPTNDSFNQKQPPIFSTTFSQPTYKPAIYVGQPEVRGFQVLVFGGVESVFLTQFRVKLRTTKE